MNESKEEKITFIAQQDIKYQDNKVYPVDAIFNLSIIKDLIKSRLVKDSTDVECFGFFDDQDEVCKSCWLSKTNKCQELQAYLKFQKTIPFQDDSLVIKTKDGDGKDTTLTVESIDTILQKLKLRETCGTYKICKVLLESDNQPFNEIMSKIQTILGENKTTDYAKVRFYQVKNLIESHTDIRFNIITQKFLQISKLPGIPEIPEVKLEPTPNA